MTDKLTVALAQITPVWLDRDRTLAKVCDYVSQAADQGASLVAFSEALVPGYPFWLEFTDGARFDDARQKELYAHYVHQGVVPEEHLRELSRIARDKNITVVFGCMERAADRSGLSLYCSLIVITADGEVQPGHRKLMPTYEERLVWAIGDGHGLRTHDVGAFKMGALNCWENWMPLPRAALHAMGEDLHIAIWPGATRHTEDITRFVAREGRSYVLSVGSPFGRADIGDHVPRADELRDAIPEECTDGGSCIAGPDGKWVVEPVIGGEQLVVAELDHAFVRRERQNLDISGHYSRPEILRIDLDRTRHRALWTDDD